MAANDRRILMAESTSAEHLNASSRFRNQQPPSIGKASTARCNCWDEYEELSLRGQWQRVSPIDSGMKAATLARTKAPLWFGPWSGREAG